MTNVKIRFNTFIGGSTFELDNVCSQAAGNGLQIVGNLMERTSPPAESAGPPNSSPTTSTPATAPAARTRPTSAPTSATIVSDTNGGNGHLRGAVGSTTADGYVPPTVRGGCPATDIDGQRRPTTGTCDAGADER